MGEISVKTGNNARNGGKNSLNRLIRCVCGKKIGPDPRNFNQRVSLGRNDLLIRTFLKAKVTAYGPIILLIGSAILNYSSFRESVKQLASDMYRASSMLSSEMLFQTNSRNKSEILRIEARKGIVGSIERINNKIDSINSQLDGKELSPTRINSELLDLNDMILTLLSNLKNAEDTKLVASSLSDGVSKLSIRKSRFKLKNKLDESMYASLFNEKKSIIKNLAQYK
ncbi:hypothetical protein Q7634_09640 [Klebsiella pneumoniae]|uniref:hypothetical protein n=1 Tax=Klebsiella pneumoniae TaxID=573 RepID=UPI00313A42DB